MTFISQIIQSNFHIISFVLAFIILAIASITDFQKREVADVINYGLFFSAIALRLLHSIITLNPFFILDGFIGFLIASVIGLGMFYTGQWGGGDAKMIIALGTLFGLSILPWSWIYLANSFLISFIINIFLVGSLFGLAWSAVMAIKNKTKFLKAWKKISTQNKKIRRAILIASILMLVAGFALRGLMIIMVPFGLLLLTTIYVYQFAKSIEKGTMTFMMPVKKLTEGEWIDKDVKHKGKYICGPKDLGISNKQIALLKKYKIKEVPVKVGMPFIPSFLLAFIATIIAGNIIVYVINMIA